MINGTFIRIQSMQCCQYVSTGGYDETYDIHFHTTGENGSQLATDGRTAIYGAGLVYITTNNS